MEIFKFSDYINKAVPEPGKRYSEQLLPQKAENVIGIFTVLPPGGQTPYHYHEKRESVLILISGKATELIEDKEIDVQAEQVLFIPAGQKHGMVNRTDSEVRYIEFQVGKPDEPDFIEVDRD